MKRITLAVAVITAILLSACNQAEKARIAELESAIDSLEAQAEKKSQTINEFFASLNEIEESLHLIKQKEKRIGEDVRNLQASEIEQDAREQISQDIIAINDIMAKNRQTISSLSKKLKQSNLKVAEFEKMLANTAREMERRDSTILRLKSNLETLNFSVDSLNLVVSTLDSTNRELAERVEQQHEKLNEALYACGSKTELIENSVITRTGGFMGIGKNSELKEDFDTSYFTKIDISTTTKIPVFATKKGIDFVTSHPSDSYTLEKNEEGIIVQIAITNPEKFWRTSRYLVIVIK